MAGLPDFPLTDSFRLATAFAVKRHFHPIRSAACALVLASASMPAFADLPNLPDKPWQDYFAALDGRKFSYTMDPWGQGKISVIADSGKAVSHSLEIPVTFLIEEVNPSGNIYSKQIDHDSLETKDKPVFKQGKATFRGKVTGGATFEAHIEIDRGVILLGGRLIDPGTIKNPVRFGVRTTFPSAYRNAKKTEKDDAKQFAKKLKDDRITIVWTDGKRTKFDSTQKLDPESKAANGPGIADLKVELAAYQGRTFGFKATPQTKILLWARQEQEAHEGFSATWYPDPAKDPEGKTRLAIEIK